MTTQEITLLLTVTTQSLNSAIAIRDDNGDIKEFVKELRVVIYSCVKLLEITGAKK